MEKKKIKLPLFADPKEFTKQLLELITKFSKIAGCKNNTQVSITSLYTNKDHDLTRNVKDSCAENYKMLMKEV